MFGNKNKDVSAGRLRNLDLLITDHKKKMIDESLDVYYESKKLEIDRRLFEHENKIALEVRELNELSVKQRKDFEHDFHDERENRMVALKSEIAGLEQSRNNLLAEKGTSQGEYFTDLMEHKDTEIERLHKIIKQLTDALGKGINIENVNNNG